MWWGALLFPCPSAYLRQSFTGWHALDSLDYLRILLLSGSLVRLSLHPSLYKGRYSSLLLWKPVPQTPQCLLCDSKMPVNVGYSVFHLQFILDQGCLTSEWPGTTCSTACMPYEPHIMAWCRHPMALRAPHPHVASTPPPSCIMPVLQCLVVSPSPLSLLVAGSLSCSMLHQLRLAPSG